jgi:hypothetical protein
MEFATSRRIFTTIRDVNDVSTVDYATPKRARRFNRRSLVRVMVIVVASIAFGWSLLMRPQLIVSNRGLPVTNERFAVRVLVNDPSSRGEFRFYSIHSFAGFHFVDWREWHRDGRYLLIPKWAVVSLTGAALVIAVVFTRRAAAR